MDQSFKPVLQFLSGFNLLKPADLLRLNIAVGKLNPNFFQDVYKRQQLKQVMYIDSIPATECLLQIIKAPVWLTKRQAYR